MCDSNTILTTVTIYIYILITLYYLEHKLNCDLVYDVRANKNHPLEISINHHYIPHLRWALQLVFLRQRGTNTGTRMFAHI